MKKKNLFRIFYDEFIEELRNLTLSRREKALVYTLFCLLLLVISLFFFHLDTKPKEIFLLLETEIPFEEKMEKLFSQEDETEKTTNAYNQAGGKYDGEEFKTLDELLKERTEIASKSEEKEKNLKAEKVSEEETIPILKEEKLLKKDPLVMPKSNKNSFVQYSLVGRSYLYDFPNPIYTCDAVGTIVVNIIVDKRGYVTKVSLNQASSTSKNRCLIDNSLEYARKARFSEGETDRQLGTITYQYQPKNQ